MRSVVFIPARYQSSRYPGKPLVNLLDKPLIIWVAELSAQAVGKNNVYVLTDDNRIVDLVKNTGFNFIMTSADALTGTDRLAEAANQIDADIYINVQGDEPTIDPKDIIRVIEEKKKYPDQIINCFCYLSEQEDPNNSNIPKVITTESGKLIYISRSALPSFKEKKNAPRRYKKQVCIYGFTKDDLLSFKKFGRKSDLEQSEDIEILRFFEFGKSIRMIETKGGTLAVDVPEDVFEVEKALKELHGI